MHGQRGSGRRAQQLGKDIGADTLHLLYLPGLFVISTGVGRGLLPELAVGGDEIGAGGLFQFVDPDAHHVQGHAPRAGTDAVFVRIVHQLLHQAPRLFQVGQDRIAADLFAHLRGRRLAIGDQDDRQLSIGIVLLLDHFQRSAQGAVDVGVLLVLVGPDALVHLGVLLLQNRGGPRAIKQREGDDVGFGAKGDDTEAVDRAGLFRTQHVDEEIDGVDPHPLGVGRVPHRLRLVDQHDDVQAGHLAVRLPAAVLGPGGGGKQGHRSAQGDGQEGLDRKVLLWNAQLQSLSRIHSHGSGVRAQRNPAKS